MAKLLPNAYPMPDPMNWEAHQEAHDRLHAAARTLDDSEYVGAIIRWQVADGYAEYLVVSMEGSGTLQHIPFADAYAVMPETIRGLRKSDIKAKVDHVRALDALFAKKGRRVR